MVKADDNTPADFISLYIICYLGFFMEGKKQPPCLLSVRNVSDLSKRHEISYVNRKGTGGTVRYERGCEVWGQSPW